MDEKNNILYFSENKDVDPQDQKTRKIENEDKKFVKLDRLFEHGRIEAGLAD